MIFYPETHTYIRNGKRYTSMTSLLKKYEPEKDWMDMATKYVRKRTREKLIEECYFKYGGDYKKWCDFDFTPENILRVWDKNKRNAAEIGSKYHAWKEAEILGWENAIETPTIDGKKVAIEMKELGPHVYPELILWDEKCMVSGQSDRVDLSLGDGWFTIDDHKTSKQISTENTFNDFFKGPISHIPAIDYYKFALQLTGYAVMLENHGLMCEEIWVNHVIFSDRKEGTVERVDRIDLPLLRDEVKELFKDFKRNHKKK